MNLEKSLQKLYGLHQFGIKLGLDKINHLLGYLGNPQKHLKCFHVAGSNAKGSVSSFISSILTEDGYKTGLYTSPHFVRFNERIRINGSEIDNDYIVDFMNEISDYIDKYEPTFFELTTAMAFKYFYENNVDISVIETGLGGRLDATNIINPVASVITTISLEHTNILGSTIPEIAFEKGEIIKPKSKVFTGLLSDEADKVITDKCRSVNSALFKLKDYLTQYNEYPVLENETGRYVIYKTPLRGKHQLTNAALAVLSVTESGMIKSPDSILKGIKNVIPNSGIQGRYEVYSESPKIIFDSSHNAEGIESFINEFVKEEKEYSKKHLIFGVMKDKNIEIMVKLFDKHFDNIYAVTFEYERAAGIGQIQKIASGVNVEVQSLEQPVKFIKEFKLNKSSECLVVLGSIYLLGNIKSQLVSERT